MRKIVFQWTCVCLLAAVATWAQSVSGTLSGKVNSAAGAGVPNAAVTVTNATTSVSQKVLTGPDGSFSVSGLPPGTYKVDVEIAGYKRTSQSNIELTTTGPATINVTLEPGNINETVEIRAHAPVVQESSGEVGIREGTRTIRELPVIDRNFQQLVGLMSGITSPTPVYPLVIDPQRNRFFSTNGQEPWNNQWQMDGVYNTEPFRNTAIRVQPMETIQETQIATASKIMQHGYYGGANVTNITRGGTNDLHGSLFEFYSGNVLRTRPFYDTLGDSVPKYVHNQMGAAGGGAIVRDKTFVFGSYEGMFDNGYSSQLTTVPVPSAIGGNFSGIPGLTLFNPNTGTATGAGRTAFANGIIPSSQINPTAASIAGLLPAPNLPGFADNYLANVPFRNHWNKADGRIDQHFSDRTSAFLRYGYTNNWAIQGSPLGDVIGAGSRDRLLAQNAIGDLAHEFSPAFITDFRFGYNRYSQKLFSAADQTALGGLPGFSNFSNNLVGINIAGLSPIGASPNLPERAVDNTFDWVWQFGYHHGIHNVKWGIDIRRIRSDGFTDTALGSMFGPNGTAYFGPGATLASGVVPSATAQFYNAFGSFLLGAPSQIGAINYLTTPTIRQSEYSGWVGDTFKWTRRFTLDLGVRYDAFSPLEPRNPGGAAFFDPLSNTFNFAGIGSTPMQFGNWDTDSFAPRVGLAAQITSKTVFRAGYSINYFQQPYMLSGFMAPTTGSVNGVQGGYTLAQFQGPFGPTLSSTTTATGPLANGASAGNLPASILQPHMDTPYVQNFSAQLQQEFTHGMMLSLGYVGALDRHLPFIEELNAAAPGAGLTGLPFAGFGRTASTLLYNSGLTSNYNSLQVNLTKRFTEGLSFLASYTWSKTLGYTSGNGFLLNPSDLRSNYGPLDFDRQNVLTISHLWELPFGLHGHSLMASALGGWQLNGVFTWSTGVPLTVTADPLTCACPGSVSFANLNGSPVLNNGTAFLNPASFSAPGVGQFGNLGRGAIRGPNDWNYDLSLFKNFRFHDHYKIEVRGEAYNLTNSTHFASPITYMNSVNFGQQISSINGAFGRQVNLGFRLLF
jgi:hypothetical protein